MKTHTIFGPPGTGKTRKLVDIVSQHKGKTILMLSFSKAAALETASRLPDDLDVKASTIHSLVFNHMGMSRASMVDGKKLAEFGKAAGFPFKGSEDGSDETQEGDEYALVLAFSNNRQIPLHESYDLFNRPGTWHRFEMFISSYLNWKNTYGYKDFDDLLLTFLKGDTTPDCPPIVALDEAQDCSPLQWAVIRKLIRAGAENVYVAGDDDQAIFEWNGADPHGMVQFTEDEGGELEVLNKSYRVPETIHTFVTDTIIRQFAKRKEKVFAPSNRNGSLTRYGDIWNVDFHRLSESGGMILVRDRFRMDEVKRALNREMIAYDVLGGGSPWTNRIAQALRKGESVDVPMHWQQFYYQAQKGGYLADPINITLSTIHQAKGREADNVVLDLQLSARALVNLYSNKDAELRVMYVGATRAAKNLCLCGENPLV
jgi:superfamily I DNA/RNA helicase